MQADHASQHRIAQLSQGTVHYLDVGRGPTLLFVHGILVNGEMWRKVYRPLSAQFRCIVPTLPLGGHVEPAHEDADLTPPGVARLLAELMVTLELADVTVVACDTGGAFVQLLAVDHPEHVGRVVLTNCDAFEDFLPPSLQPLQTAFRLPGFAAVFGIAVRSKLVQKSLASLAAHAPLEPEVGESYYRGLIRSHGVRRDARKAVLGISNRYTLDAAAHFPDFQKPVLIVWGEDDTVFPVSLGERLARAFPDTRLERVKNSKAFVAEDQPERLSALISAFVRERTLT